VIAVISGEMLNENHKATTGVNMQSPLESYMTG